MSKSHIANKSRKVAFALSTALVSVALTGCVGKVAPSAQYSAAEAKVALDHGDVSDAIEYAESAVLASPRDAATRALLANAYLEAGRFASSATTFGEAMKLGDTHAQTILGYALAQIASGKPGEALATLDSWQDQLDPADFGLAVALAGRPQQGVHILGKALRDGQNTVKMRQNLAYAFALQGNWRAARLMIAEDVPAGKIGDRITKWAHLVAPGREQQRVAELLGTPMVKDTGQPAMLALANFPSVDQLAFEAASQAPANIPPAAEAKPYEFAQTGELPPVAQESVPAQPQSAPTDPSVAQAFAAYDDADLARPDAGIHFIAAPVVQETPSSHLAKPVRQARADTNEASSHEAFDGNYRVQLGSYHSMSNASAAWKIFLERHPQLQDAKRVITKAKVDGRIYYRVAAGGFARTSAQSFCSSVKQGGHGCFAYSSSNSLPGTIDNNVRVAVR